MSKFWKFQNKSSDNDNESVELLIEGDIIDYNDTWLREWLGIPYTGKNKFRNELKRQSGKDIVVKIDSNGGNVWAATGIYDALKEHSGKVTVKIIRAASSATIPAMAGDEILISIAGLFMIHNPFPANGVQGDANKLRQVADMLDTVKEIIINAYTTKTNLSREEIWSLMDSDTLMSANMALQKGFVDRIINGENDRLETNNIGMSLSKLAIVNNASESIEKAINELNKNAGNANETNNQKKEGGEEVEIKNVEELRNAYPDFVKEIEDSARNKGAEQERNRIKDIEEISSNIAPDLLNKAKFEEPMNAKDLAFEAMKADNKKGQDYINNTIQDNNNSGVDDVETNNNNDGDDEPKTVQDKVFSVAAQFDAKRRGVKING